jgi:cell wall-associated NlpC family hydrolase
MIKGSPGTLVLVIQLVVPLVVLALAPAESATQTGRDVERAVRIGTLVLGVAREINRETATSRRESGSRTTTRPAGTGASSRTGARVVTQGEQYLGVPYKWGGNTPREGFDCSGFVKYVYADNGVTMPRNSRQQSQVGEWIPSNIASLRQGDLMFFASDGRRIDHVAMYAGSNRILHSSSSGGGVLYDNLDSRRGQWYRRHFVAARRVADDRGSLVDAIAAARLVFDYFDPPDRAPRVF